MSLVPAGKYTAKVVSHAITETSQGLPQAVIRFEFDTKEGPRELSYFGSFKEKAAEFTLKALVNCGLKGANPAGDLELGKEVSIVVEIDQDQNGNDRNVVRWVNKPGAILNPIDKREAAAKLERFSGAVMALKQAEGQQPQPKNHAPKFETEDDEIPDFMR